MGVKRNGVGQYVDTSMLDGAVSGLPVLANDYFVKGVSPKAAENILNGQNACYEVYETKDGRYISIGAIEPHLWANFCDAIGKEEFKAYQRDLTKQDEMFAYLRDMFKSKTQAEWIEKLTGVDCCWAPVKNLEEVFADPQVVARDMVYEMTDPEGTYGSVRMIGSAVKLSETPARKELFPPRKGEHNTEMLKSIGYTDEQIAELQKNGVI